MVRGEYAGALLGGVALLSACAIDDRRLMLADGAAGDGPSVHQLLLGNFEDGTLAPNDPRFQVWEYGAERSSSEPGAGTFVTASIVTPGYGGSRALQVDWQVVDAVDGQQNYPGVLLGTGTQTIDLSGYARLVFAEKYQHHGGCKAVPLLTAILRCNDLKSSFLSFAGMSSDWIVQSIDFGNLQETTDAGVLRERCLKQIDHVYFLAQVSLADGDCASGTLFLDDIAVQM